MVPYFWGLLLECMFPSFYSQYFALKVKNVSGMKSITYITLQSTLIQLTNKLINFLALHLRIIPDSVLCNKLNW